MSKKDSTTVATVLIGLIILCWIGGCILSLRPQEEAGRENVPRAVYLNDSVAVIVWPNQAIEVNADSSKFKDREAVYFTALRLLSERIDSLENK